MSLLAFSAVVLAAGHSSRMGRDKALLPAPDGMPLWQRQRNLLSRAGAAEIFLSARDDQAWTQTAAGFAATIPDAIMHGGPLAGIAAAMAVASHSHLAVLAVDLPRMESCWFAALLASCAPGIGAVGRSASFFEPLAAIYPRELLPAIDEALQCGDLSLQRLIAGSCERGLLRPREIGIEEIPLFENWNTPRG